jgi:hypothetical protein
MGVDALRCVQVKGRTREQRTGMGMRNGSALVDRACHPIDRWLEEFPLERSFHIPLPIPSSLFLRKHGGVRSDLLSRLL